MVPVASTGSVVSLASVVASEPLEFVVSVAAQAPSVSVKILIKVSLRNLISVIYGPLGGYADSKIICWFALMLNIDVEQYYRTSSLLNKTDDSIAPTSGAFFPT